LLDQKIAERNAGEPALAIRDRIEHGSSRLVRIDELLTAAGQDRRDRSGNFTLERDLDEDQRIIVERRMKKREAPPIRRINAPTQIVPVANFVDRLVADELFKDTGRRRPVDALQHKEATVEP